MLTTLSIQNYALINQLNIDFGPGFSIITGETGAGKSILLGALSLILGQRADTSALHNKDKKCIVEGRFNIGNYNLKGFFAEHDLDYEDITHLRREIASNGKSRAFINDTPVNLIQLRELGIQLVDIHSQHQNLELSNYSYQLSVVDTYCAHNDLIEKYVDIYKEYKEAVIILEELTIRAEKEKTDLDYFQFQFNQLDETRLSEDEQEKLEEEIETLNNAEDIKSRLTSAAYLLSGDEGGNIVDNLRQVNQLYGQLRTYFKKAEDLCERLNSAYLELKDIAEETDLLSNDIEHNPVRIAEIEQRLDIIYSLQQKHHVTSVSELIEIKNNLNERIASIASFDQESDVLRAKIERLVSDLEKLASKLSQGRKLAISGIEKKITELLQQLGMPGAAFKINMERISDFGPRGFDKVKFLFSANKKVDMQEISKTASGGELSRLMLSLKSLISQSASLPTIIFDEIDTGVSGDIADKMGNIMKIMAKDIQVVSITHLPQIAGKGDSHYVVYKQENNQGTTTNMMLLAKDDRIREIAKMLSGESLTPAALENAKELLKN